MSTAHMLLLIATGFYGLSLVCAFFAQRRPVVTWIFLVPALAANTAAVAIRYHMAWPMLPMYLSTAAVPAFLGVLFFFAGRNNASETAMLRRIILTLALIIAAATVFFPKDFYLPFIKSQTLAAHLFLWFTVAGKGCFLVSAAWAMAGLLKNTNQPSTTHSPLSPLSVFCRCWVSLRSTQPTNTDHRQPTTEYQSPNTDYRSPNTGHRPPTTEYRPPNTKNRKPNTEYRVKRWTIWGFAFWTLGMFSGELWSYLGWGTPVVWDDPAITTVMATWFFYICLLHLHLTGTWTARGRGIYAAAGAIVILGLNCVPDLGPFRGLF